MWCPKKALSYLGVVLKENVGWHQVLSQHNMKLSQKVLWHNTKCYHKTSLSCPKEQTKFAARQVRLLVPNLNFETSRPNLWDELRSQTPIQHGLDSCVTMVHYHVIPTHTKSHLVKMKGYVKGSCKKTRGTEELIGWTIHGQYQEFGFYSIVPWIHHEGCYLLVGHWSSLFAPPL
jgi:hypothetical protein